MQRPAASHTVKRIIPIRECYFDATMPVTGCVKIQKKEKRIAGWLPMATNWSASTRTKRVEWKIHEKRIGRRVKQDELRIVQQRQQERDGRTIEPEIGEKQREGSSQFDKKKSKTEKRERRKCAEKKHIELLKFVVLVMSPLWAVSLCWGLFFRNLWNRSCTLPLRRMH